MNRHERRRAKVLEKTTLSPKEMDEMRHLCAWDGCAENYGGDMPDNWR